MQNLVLIPIVAVPFAVLFALVRQRVSTGEVIVYTFGAVLSSVALWMVAASFLKVRQSDPVLGLCGVLVSLLAAIFVVRHKPIRR